MHLIAPYFPKEIKTNFDVNKKVQSLIGAMYESERHNQPCFRAEGNIFNLDIPFKNLSSNAERVAVAYSAGKDSMWNLWWAQEKYGAENVLVVHVSGLNKGVGSREAEYVRKQQQEFGFPYLKIINLLNDSKNSGHKVMRSRDIFLAGIIIPSALEFGASKIITEGFEDVDETELFSGKEENMACFNKILDEIGIPVQVAWRNQGEMECVKDLFLHRPGWMPHVSNCFAPPCYLVSLRRNWQKKFPGFPLYDSQCGFCIKCRIINLGRILWDSAIRDVKTEDVIAYLKDTAGWINANRARLIDMIEGSFLNTFKKACEKYEFEAPIK